MQRESMEFDVVIVGAGGTRMETELFGAPFEAEQGGAAGLGADAAADPTDREVSAVVLADRGDAGRPTILFVLLADAAVGGAPQLGEPLPQGFKP